MKLTKSQLREIIREEIKSLNENKKSKEASLVLQLMDKDYSYERALTAVLKKHKNIDRATLEKELDKYI
jgi:hypothetical protein